MAGFKKDAFFSSKKKEDVVCAVGCVVASVVVSIRPARLCGGLDPGSNPNKWSCH
jgi:hypothetical protein